MVEVVRVVLMVLGFVGGYRPPPNPMCHLTNEVPRTSGPRRLKAAAGETLPAKYDLRDEGGVSYLSPVRNQGAQYGTCWAHAAMVGMEYLLKRDEGIDADLSENNLANMHGFANNAFDEGGSIEMATAVFLRGDGPVTEALDPYPSKGTSVRERGVRAPRKVVLVPARTGVANAQTLQNELNVIKRALMKYGPLAASYADYDDYRKGAAYYCHNLDKRYCNHAISLVGWDDNYAATNFKKTPPGNGAFIIKNSWGADMFDRGYMYISYYDKTFGFYPLVAYARLTKGEDYGQVYEYDRYGYIGETGFGQETAYAMNVFMARKDERLAAFGFYALKPNTEYSAKVVIDPVMKNGVLTGEEIEVAAGVMEEAGYEVLVFSSIVKVGAGTNFAMVVKMRTPNFYSPIAVMENCSFGEGDPYVSGVKAVKGRSYACKDPAKYTWNDISGGRPDRPLNPQYFCCKVYTAAETTDATTCGEVAVAHSWLDAYSAGHDSGDCLARIFYGSYNALSEHVAANRMEIAESFARGIDPDNESETNLVAKIGFDAFGLPVIGISPRNDNLWNYTTLGSADLGSWHEQVLGDRFFRVRLEPK